MAGVLTLNLVLQKSKVDDIRRIQKLNICAAQLQDIGVLRQASGLEVLSMSLNEISELGALSNCRRLTELYLRKNHIRDINQVLHLSRLPYLEVLNLSDNPISRDPNYRRFVIAAVPPLERLDDRDITDDERDDALAVFPQLLSFAPPPSRYAQPMEGYTAPSVQERQAQARSLRSSNAGLPANSNHSNNNNHQAPVRKAAPPPANVHQDPRAAPRGGHSGAAQAPPSPPPPPVAAAAAAAAVRANAVNDYPSSDYANAGPSETSVVQAVKVLCSELSPEALDEVRRFIDSMSGY